MSLFIAGAIVSASLIVGLLVALSGQIRSACCRRRDIDRDEKRSANISRPSEVLLSDSNPEAITVLPNSRAAAYREILDALGDELDDDIADWEAVLDDFPQVIGPERFCQAEDRASELALEASREKPTENSSPRVHFTVPQRTRRVSDDEREMILRLMCTGFACEEIALWLNLPLERVQELLPRK